MNPFGLFPRLSHPYLVLWLKLGRRRPGCAPAAHTTRSRPRAAAATAAAEIKEKETKHHGKRSSPFKAPKTRQAHASPPRPRYGVGGRGAKGEGSSFSLPCATPPFRNPPKFSRNLKVSGGGEKGMLFRVLTAALQLHAGTLLFLSPAGSMPSQPATQFSLIIAAPM